MPDERAVPRRRHLGRRLVLLALAVAAVVVARLDRRVREGFADGMCRDRVRLHGAPREIALGDEVGSRGLLDDLGELGYRHVSALPIEPGTFAVSPDRIDLFLRPAPRPEGDRRPAERVVLHLASGRVARIERSRPGSPVDAVELDPPVLAGVFGEHWAGREHFRLGDAPAHVVDAVLAAEDARFLAHPGFDANSILRALRVNLAEGGVRQGGSTISQQLVKNRFLTPERSLLRKLRELPMAVLLEARFDKRQIIECYLATVYLGHDRLVGVHGLAEGARAYFGRSVSELTIGQAATLAGMIRAPNHLSPLRHRARAVARRDEVLGQMFDNGWITREQAAAARAETLPRPPRRGPPAEAWFVRQVRRELGSAGLAPDEIPAGSTLFTTLDPRLQRVATTAAGEAVGRIGKGGGRRAPQVAVVALDPRDGSVRALVGGNDYLASQVDRAVRWRRPVGGLFTPFVYLLALSDPRSGVTAASRLDDGPLALHVGGETWEPREGDGRFRGEVTLPEAVAADLRLPAIRLAKGLGIERVARFGSSLPLGGQGLPPLPSTAIGAFDASLLDVAASWSAFPQLGRVARPRFLRGARSPAGRSLLAVRSATARVVNAPPAWVMHALLADASAAEAGAAGARPYVARSLATPRDAWHLGYTRSLVVGVRIGAEGSTGLPAGAAAAARRVVEELFAEALAGRPADDVAAPRGTEIAEIDPSSGLRWSPGCGAPRREPFVAGTVPRRTCAEGADRGTRRRAPRTSPSAAAGGTRQRPSG